MALRPFLKDVATNSQTLSSWKKDKEAAMTAAGLSDSEKKALRSGDPKQIRDALGDPVAGDTTIILIFW
jgi:hypothetical protein